METPRNSLSRSSPRISNLAVVPVKANTLGNRLEEFIQSELVNSSESTKIGYRFDMAKFSTFLNRNGGLKRDSFSKYLLKKKNDGSSQNTVAKSASKLRKFFRWCWKMGYTNEMWYEFVPTVKSVPTKEEIQIIGQDEYLNIRKNCTDFHREWLVVLGYSTGMRMGDCCTLRWSQIDQEQQVIRKLQGKTSLTTGACTMVPYISGSDLHQFIIKQWSQRDDIVLEEDNYVDPVMYLSYSSNQRSVVNSMRQIFDKAGLPNKSFKHFRSTFESRMANSGMSLALAAKITGRSDPSSLMRYIKPDLEVARECVAKALELHHHVDGFK